MIEFQKTGLSEKQLYYLGLMEKALNEQDGGYIFFIEDLAASAGFSIPTFYDHFPVGSELFYAIKAHLNASRVRLHKRSYMNLVAQSDAGVPTSTIYLSKLTQSKESKDHVNTIEKEQEQTSVIQPPNITFDEK